MIKAFFFKNNNHYCSFKIEGHSGYASKGDDIVCAAVSSAVDMTIGAIKNVVKQQCEVEINSAKALVNFKLTRNSAQQDVVASSFIEALYLHIANISKSFPKNVTVRVQDNS